MPVPTEQSVPIGPPPPAKLNLPRAALWFALCLIQGGLLAWAATAVEWLRAPLVVFSVLVGAVLGATLVGLFRLLEIGHRSTILTGAVAAALAMIAAQHYIAYRLACRQAQEDAATYLLAKRMFGDSVLGSQPVPPDDFATYLRWRAARGIKVGSRHLQDSGVWMLWFADAALVAAATIGIVYSAARQPYCDHCRSWYRSARRGAVDANRAAELAAIAGIDLAAAVETPRYRLVACRGGCGPTGFELQWSDKEGRHLSARRWLDSRTRNDVAACLDLIGSSGSDRS